MNEGCDLKMLFGNKGINLLNHYDACLFTKIKCMDCKKTINIGEKKTHLSETKICLEKNIYCGICRGIFKYRHMKEHKRSDLHLQKLDEFVLRCRQENIILSALNVSLSEENKNLVLKHSNLRKIIESYKPAYQHNKLNLVKTPERRRHHYSAGTI